MLRLRRSHNLKLFQGKKDERNTIQNLIQIDNFSYKRFKQFKTVAIKCKRKRNTSQKFEIIDNVSSKKLIQVYHYVV